MQTEDDSPVADAIQLKLQSVAVCFDGHPPVLHGLDFAVRRGEFVSIVGPSGCGKTTVLRLIAGLTVATDGLVSVPGNPRTAFVFQEPNLLPWRNVVDNIRLPLELSGVPRGQQEEAIRGSLRLIGLQRADERKYPRMLSGGMKMRVSLARAMVTRPSVLLLDEPFAALDDMLRQQLNEELLRIWQSRQWTVLFVTHNVAEAVFLSHRVLVMSRHPGRIVETVDIPFDYPRNFTLRGQAEFARRCELISEALRGGGS